MGIRHMIYISYFTEFLVVFNHVKINNVNRDIQEILAFEMKDTIAKI
jgi:hypothetical protein